MIIIFTKDDLKSSSRDVASSAMILSDVSDDKMPCSGWAEDVYFWRDGRVKPLKRRNAPLFVPEWLENLEGVDR